MPELFSALERVVAKYRSDVHQLASAAPPDSLTALEGHLQRPLPTGLRQFLARYNGAALFRGTLRVRATSEVAVARADVSEIVLFADQGDRRWAWAEDGRGGWAFGPWDGETLAPLHATFAGWLAGAIAVLDARVRSDDDARVLRHEADPDDPYQLLWAGESALRRGRPDEAKPWLERALARDPHLAAAWQLRGDTLAVRDRTAARRAWLEAFRRTRLPSPWPGAPGMDPDALRSLAAAFSDPEDWEHEVERFLAERVDDVRRAEELAPVVAAARELARSRARRGRRQAARDALSELLQRCRTFTFDGVPYEALLELAAHEVELGHHDEAEALLRRLRRHGPAELQGAGHLLLARVAIVRQEPWAEDILDDAVRAGLDEIGRAEATLLRIERATRQEPLPAEVDGWLDQASRTIPRLGRPRVTAHLALVHGEVLRARGDLAGARDVWRQGRARLGDSTDLPELRYRLELRLGDVALQGRRVEAAHAHYQVAARGFADHQLPVRQAWALLRLARLAREPKPLLKAAKAAFEEADLAAGLAAVDAYSGRQGASLVWHLERATAQARARYHAQRSRAPYDRSDADRPERRLGAHRLAIAACDRDVVDTIARELDGAVASMAAGRVHAIDPPVLRYIAAVDLLAGHRSYAAAAKLLQHLFSGRIEGPALSALQGAVSRSLNAALVDGLLRAVEAPGDHPPYAVASAAEVLGLRREEAAIAPLAAMASPGSAPRARKAAIVALGRIGSRSVVDVLLPGLDDPTLAEPAALSLLMLGDRRGIDFHGTALVQGRKDLSGSPGEIVGRYGGPTFLPLLRGAALDDDARALGALQGLGLMGDPRALATLVKALDSRDLRVLEVASGALQILTGREEDVNNPGFKNRWRSWVEAHGGDLREGLRYRAGVVFEPSQLIDSMDHPKAWVRRTAYDELVITMGARLPFDSDGPWRVQRAHIAGWRSWWASHRSQFPAGGWFLDGRSVH